MPLDNSDIYIRDHIQSMTMREMADHLGLSKSTVSRRVARLRADGEIDDAIAQEMRRATEQARDDLGGCAISDLDRLAKLDALKERLEAEFDTSGGASLARVSSEYRKTLEEMASISTNMELARIEGQEVDIVTAIELMGNVADQFLEVERRVVYDIAEAALVYLDSVDIVSYTALSKVRVHVALSKNEYKGKAANESRIPD